MIVVLRFFLGTLVLLALAACSTKPLETSLPSSMRVSSITGHNDNPPKTLSSDILSAIALERVTGRRFDTIDIVEMSANRKNSK